MYTIGSADRWSAYNEAGAVFVGGIAAAAVRLLKHSDVSPEQLAFFQASLGTAHVIDIAPRASFDGGLRRSSVEGSELV